MVEFSLDNFVKEYESRNCPPREELKARINSFMKKFEEKEEEEKRARKRKVVDEDGFILVQKKSKGDPLPPKEKKTKTLVDFYRFQLKDRKLSELEELKRKFELDKQKLAKLKSQRKHKPL